MKNRMVKINGIFLIICICIINGTIANAEDSNINRVILPDWEEPSGMTAIDLSLGVGEIDRAGWGHYSPNERAYFDEVLPSVFNL